MEYKRYGKNEDLYWADAQDSDLKLKVIMEGTYKERHFVIGAHRTGNPNAYIEMKTTDSMFVESKEYEDYDGGLNRVNGGSTYFGKAYWNEDDKRTYVGWDYGHADDYNARHPKLGGKKWDLIDILMEISVAECEIEMANEEDPEYWNRVRANKD